MTDYSTVDPVIKGDRPHIYEADTQHNQDKWRPDGGYVTPGIATMNSENYIFYSTNFGIGQPNEAKHKFSETVALRIQLTIESNSL